MNALLFFLILAALLLLQDWLIRHFGLSNLHYSRTISQHVANVGDEMEMVEEFSNRKLLPLPYLMAESAISPHLHFKKDESLAVQGERYHKSVFFLGPYSKVTRRYRVRLGKRGYFKVDSVAVTVGDLLGLSTACADVSLDCRVEVYPQLLETPLPPIPSSKWQGDLTVKRWILPDPFLTNGIRPYQPSDNPRQIHWGASARTGSLQVKTFDYTADPKLLVIVNGQIREDQWADLLEYEQGPVEYAISMAATLCKQALDGGVEAGFAINLPVDKQKGTTILLPSRNPGRMETILSAMAHLTIVNTTPFQRLLTQLEGVTGMDILILSTYSSAAIEQSMAQLRLRGNAVAMQLLDCPQDGGANEKAV